jgi:geranylgeranyl pyrophosphate synthase
MRRNQPSVFHKYGREISIVAGDYLYAKAFLLLAGMKNIFINEAFAYCAHIMCEGEMKQIERRNQFLMPEAEYLKIIHKKTAALFQAACAGGGYFAGLTPDQIEKMGDYGYKLGMAFQIVDDVLDLVGESESLGKTIGLDFYKNDVTLPILYLFQSLEAGQKDALLADMKAGAPNLFARIKAAAIETGSVDKATAKAKVYIDQALQSLSVVPDSACKESLTRLAYYCIERVR